MISRIIGSYRNRIVKIVRLLPCGGYDLYLPYYRGGFRRAFLSSGEERSFPSFYYKFENVSRRAAKKIIDLVRRVKYTGVFFKDKAMLDELIQQNL